MRHTIPFAIILYAISATIDAYQGITTPNPTITITLRIASATTITATAIHILSKNKPLRSLPFIMISLVLSMIALTLGQMSSAAVINIAIKAAAIILTIEPEIMKIELITEDREESDRST